MLFRSFSERRSLQLLERMEAPIKTMRKIFEKRREYAAKTDVVVEPLLDISAPPAYPCTDFDKWMSIFYAVDLSGATTHRSV